DREGRLRDLFVSSAHEISDHPRQFSARRTFPFPPFPSSVGHPQVSNPSSLLPFSLLPFPFSLFPWSRIPPRPNFRPLDHDALYNVVLGLPRVRSSLRLLHLLAQRLSQLARPPPHVTAEAEQDDDRDGQKDRG